MAASFELDLFGDEARTKEGFVDPRVLNQDEPTVVIPRAWLNVLRDASRDARRRGSR